MVGLQPAQFLLKLLLRALDGTDQIMGQLGRQIDLVPAVVLRKDLSYCFLAARIDIGHVQIVDTMIDRVHHFLLRLVQIDLRSLLREAHTTVSEDRELISFPIFSVLHTATCLSYTNHTLIMSLVIDARSFAPHIAIVSASSDPIFPT